MKRFSFFFLVISAGILAVISLLLLSLHLETIVSVADSWFFGTGSGKSELLFYVIAAAIPLLSGILVCLAVALISGSEDKRHEREQEKAGRSGAGGRADFTAYINSINASVVKLKNVSARMREQTRRLSLLDRETAPLRAGEKPERHEEDIYDETGADTVSVTMDNSEVSEVRMIYPVRSWVKDVSFPEGSFPQEPFPPRESRQKIWYFPNI
ncbi:MAG: hypothetical protein LBP23_04835 [Treponema sp.]|jgi:hypothetical protein|nr:hypothetical protein [Treponema sp.]